jgi:NAD(P)-dependent dehydrogenase (short-subunit alcohol dehydrogenase family)
VKGKVCLVTGANTGVGRAAARGLAETGATVLLICRSREKGEEARDSIRKETGNPAVHLLLGDLSSQEQVRRLAHACLSNHPRIHVLVNNAGVYLWERALTADGLEMTLAVNHLAPFLLTHLLLDGLKAAAPSRIINVSSIVHRVGRIHFDDLGGGKRYTGSRAYDQSKLANVLFTQELSRRLQGTGVTANSMEPGGVRTDFFRDFRGFRRLLVTVGAPFLRSPEKGAQTILHLATSPEAVGITGGHFASCRKIRPARRGRDREVARRLWDVSRDLVGIS